MLSLLAVVRILPRQLELAYGIYNLQGPGGYVAAIKAAQLGLKVHFALDVTG